MGKFQRIEGRVIGPIFFMIKMENYASMKAGSKRKVFYRSVRVVYTMIVITGLVLIGVFLYFFRKSLFNDPSTVNIWVLSFVFLPLIIIGLFVAVFF
ncbi:hypothetical protein HM131_14640 [Halobacillus mangrovi]|uniref:Uncharacterized protein n=1 Tax=Halobacillus mangrovi TaxID=402384 RepID=A0A1W5ZXM8_9BACI|nr:hypothetical protein HM131_14640 [Halobacillus mangrovi]